MAGLPNAEMAYVEERKITEYLLALGHPDGHDKRWFVKQALPSFRCSKSGPQLLS